MLPKRSPELNQQPGSRTENAHSAKRRLTLILLLFLLLILTYASLFSGRYPVPGFTGPFRLFTASISEEIFFNLRLPRILSVLIGGAVLAASGFVFQMIFSNPLVEPGFLGVSQGAAFGAALSILFFSSSFFVIQVRLHSMRLRIHGFRHI